MSSRANGSDTRAAMSPMLRGAAPATAVAPTRGARSFAASTSLLAAARLASSEQPALATVQRRLLARRVPRRPRRASPTRPPEDERARPGGPQGKADVAPEVATDNGLPLVRHPARCSGRGYGGFRQRIDAREYAGSSAPAATPPPRHPLRCSTRATRLPAGGRRPARSPIIAYWSLRARERCRKVRR
jgi:hypothetical protein